MKKAICFSLIVMFLALASSPLLVKADEVSVGGYYDDTDTLTSTQISTLENTALMLEYLRQGGTIDVKNTDSSYDTYSLIEDFGNFVRDIIEVGGDIINPFQTEVQYHGIQPIRYSQPYINNLLGVLPFYALQEPEEPTPSPDPNYNQYLNCINGSVAYGSHMPYFPYIGNWVFIPPDYDPQRYFIHGDISNRTIYDVPNNRGFTNQNTSPNVTIPISVGNNVIDINIIGDDINGYTIIHGPTTLDNTMFEYIYNSPRTTAIVDLNYSRNRFSTYNGLNYSTASWLDTQFNASYNNLTNVFEFLVTCVKNVNIYVNGVPWSIVTTPTTNYNIELSTGTVTPENNGKVRWEYDTYIYYDIDLIEQELSLLLDEIRNLNHPTVIRFDDLKDVIVDVDGQPAVAVKVLADPRNIDKIYLDTYGPIIPAFLPMFTPVIDDTDMFDIASTAVSPIPEDLLEVFGYMFMGVLFIGFIHRLLE